jgi:cation diffusion facilitator CzcD-associated flavoprotein CzcO
MPNNENPLSVSASHWLTDLEASLKAKDGGAIRALFLDDSHWRDLASFTWDLGSVSGIDQIEQLLVKVTDEFQPRNFRLSERHSRPRHVTRSGRDVVEAYFQFETHFGTGTGVIRLVADDTGDAGHRAWILFTKLDSLKGFEPLPAGTRPSGVGFDRTDTRLNWLDRRIAKKSYEDRDPEVLIVGGGHSGIFAAVHLDRLGVDTLIVDKFARVGDNWRTRYHSLALHNQSGMMQFPFMSFPETFPEYLPKDKFANWFESYVESMEVNFWTSTEFIGGDYDESARRWNARIRQSDGTERVMRPRHIIIATGGVGGTPNIPALPGREAFGGEVLHTKTFRSGADFAGKRALVIGVGTSGHDVAYDLYNNGASVAMMQRSPTTVVNIDSANMYFSQYEDGTPLAEADLMGMSGFVLPVLRESAKRLTAMSTARDRPLLDRLEAAGLRLDDGPDGTGWMMKFYERAGGYYINVGCAELIADRQIDIIQASDLETLVDGGLKCVDGTLHAVDVIVLATGYLNQQTEVRAFFGDEVAERVGKIGGLDDGGEIRNAWKPTAQDGLWFMVSGVASARTNAPVMALMIKADLEGLTSRS